MKQHYGTLDLKEGASQEEIQAAYERLSKQLNPTENDNQEFFIEEYEKVQEAYKALTGHEQKRHNEVDAKPTEVSNLFEDSNSLVSILKKFKASENAKKIEIINYLEAYKNENKTYQQALAILYRKEDIERIRDAKEKDNVSNTKSENIDNIKIKEGKPIKSPIKKSSKKSKKLILGTLVILSLIFGITYIYFIIKVNDFKNEIPYIIKQSEHYQNNSRQIWETKFLENHPEIVNEHLNDETNKGFSFSESDRSITKDSLISFFVYSKIFSLELYKPDFFECVYYNSVNTYNYWNHYTVGLDENSTKKSSLLLYLEMFKKISNKYNASEKEFEDLIQIVGGLGVFHSVKRSKIDVKCKECINNYQMAYEINNIAINDFYVFTEEYITHKNEIDQHNKSFLLEFDNVYNKLTAGMNEPLKEKLKSKLEEESYPKKNQESSSFAGSRGGLGNITYSFDKYDDNLLLLNEYADNTYTKYYSTNYLNTGDTPYSYCYGRNPYCTPLYGYAECSFIDIRASNSSDVVVIVKKNNRVYAHAYIRAGGYYKFKLGNGDFQTFFYYGNGWNPNKFIKITNCGQILGGFVNNESLDKSEVIRLYNSSMSYTLYTVEDGNFTPKKSNKNEAF
ncbi:J domain-containing protein [Winogradskyella sp.]|nr:J domain-containing protein [Winogradskyella sp.]